MPRPRRTVRPTTIHFAVPEDLRARMDLRLFSAVEGRIPHGAYSEYLCGLIRKDLERTKDEPNPQ